MNLNNQSPRESESTKSDFDFQEGLTEFEVVSKTLLPVVCKTNSHLNQVVGRNIFQFVLELVPYPMDRAS